MLVVGAVEQGVAPDMRTLRTSQAVNMESAQYQKRTQQSVPDNHRDNAPDAGDCPEGVRKSQAVSYALSFFWLDGFAVPAPAQVPTGQAASRWTLIFKNQT